MSKINKLYRSLTILIITTIALVVQPNASYAKMELYGEAVQGAMLVGITHANALVEFAGVKQTATAKGTFVIGLHRDAKAEVLIAIIHKGEKNTYAINVKKRTYNEQRINGLNKKKVSPPKSLLARLKKEGALIKKSRTVFSNKTYYSTRWMHPTTGIITGVYGSRRVLNGKPKTPHYGVDYATKTGTKIVAPQTGVVRLVQEDNFYSGKTIIIDHGMGINTAYLHMSKTFVKKGDVVKKGQKIGLVGTTGRSTGAHLDWRLNWGNVRLDPALLDGIDLGVQATGKKIK